MNAGEQGTHYGENGQMNADDAIRRSGQVPDRFQNGESATDEANQIQFGRDVEPDATQVGYGGQDDYGPGRVAPNNDPDVVQDQLGQSAQASQTDSADMKRGPFTHQQENEGSQDDLGISMAQTQHDTDYQPDQYGIVREDAERKIDAAVDEYADKLPGGRNVADQAKQQIGNVLDQFETQAADALGDQNGL